MSGCGCSAGGSQDEDRPCLDRDRLGNDLRLVKNRPQLAVEVAVELVVARSARIVGTVTIELPEPPPATAEAVAISTAWRRRGRPTSRSWWGWRHRRRWHIGADRCPTTKNVIPPNEDGIMTDSDTEVHYLQRPRLAPARQSSGQGYTSVWSGAEDASIMSGWHPFITCEGCLNHGDELDPGRPAGLQLSQRCQAAPHAAPGSGRARVRRLGRHLTIKKLQGVDTSSSPSATSPPRWAASRSPCSWERKGWH